MSRVDSRNNVTKHHSEREYFTGLGNRRIYRYILYLTLYIILIIGEGSDENEKCFGYEEDGNWIFSTSPLECNTNIFTNATHIVYTNYLHGKIGIENAIITRSKPMNLEFKCVFSNEVDIELENPVETKEDSMEVQTEYFLSKHNL